MSIKDERRELERLDIFNKSQETASDIMRFELTLADAFLRGYRAGICDGYAMAKTIKSEEQGCND